MFRPTAVLFKISAAVKAVKAIAVAPKGEVNEISNALGEWRMKLHGVLQRESGPMKKVDLDYDISYEGPGNYRKYMAVARINGVPYGKGVAWPHKSAAKELACREALERWKAKTPLEGIPPREEEPRGRGKKKKPRKDKNMNLEREGSAGSLVTKMDDSENLLLIREL